MQNITKFRRKAKFSKFHPLKFYRYFSKIRRRFVVQLKFYDFAARNFKIAKEILKKRAAIIKFNADAVRPLSVLRVSLVANVKS